MPTAREHPKKQPVESSNIASIGYDPSTGILEIEFVSGATYAYYDVPPQVHRSLMKATSPGTYFHKYVKGFYQCERIE